MIRTLLALTLLPLLAPAADGPAFTLDADARVSLGVFDKKSGALVRTLTSGKRFSAGTHTVPWDGLDNRARPVPTGDYEWRLLTSPGFTARYLTTVGIDPPGGEHPVPKNSWVGDHNGPGTVAADGDGIVVGAAITEGGMMAIRTDADLSEIRWRRPQFYKGGRLTRVATTADHTFMLHPDGTLRRLRNRDAHVATNWKPLVDNSPANDVAALGPCLVIAHRDQNTVTWLSRDSGATLATATLEAVSNLTPLTADPRSPVIASSGRSLFHVTPGKQPRKIAGLPGVVGALDYDPDRAELWAAVDGHTVLRLDHEGKITARYGGSPRPHGPYDRSKFNGVTDVAADRTGGFLVTEPTVAPRRLARFAADGSHLTEHVGAMSFYVNGTFDPAEPSTLYGIAPEGSVNVYRIDFDDASWEIVATYATGGLGDNLFPYAGNFKAVRRNGQLFLYHRAVPAVLRLDPEKRAAVPVAIAGTVRNRGRSFYQFAGSGEEGYPEPWVAAARHHGYQKLAEAPKLYSWADGDGDGEFDPEEFRFYPGAELAASFHNPGDFTADGHFISTTPVNHADAFVRLPATGWEGPRSNAPRWDWSKATTAGTITADSYGFGSPRAVAVAPSGHVYTTYQAGIMIRDHGQYEGGGWPEAGMRGSRVLGFGPDFSPTFAAGRQSKIQSEANRGNLYYPMFIYPGPGDTVIVNDQTKQPAQVWTADGLYAGSLLDHRADDGLDRGFYSLHGDDNQGGAITRTADGRTYWLMPYVGHNRLYEITGCDKLGRQSGTVRRPNISKRQASGTGLAARFHRDGKILLETTCAPFYYEQFGAEPHTDRLTAPYDATWTGTVVPPFTDHYQFVALLGKGEHVSVSVAGKSVYAAGEGIDPIDLPTPLTAGQRTPIKITYHNPEARAELKLLWRSTTLDPTPLKPELLHTP